MMIKRITKLASIVGILMIFANPVVVHTQDKLTQSVTFKTNVTITQTERLKELGLLLLEMKHENQVIRLKLGNPILSDVDSKLVFEGEIVIPNICTIRSDLKEPLVVQAQKEGFIYLQGRGEIFTARGKINLPAKDFPQGTLLSDLRDFFQLLQEHERMALAPFNLTVRNIPSKWKNQSAEIYAVGLEKDKKIISNLQMPISEKVSWQTIWVMPTRISLVGVLKDGVPLLLPRKWDIKGLIMGEKVTGIDETYVVLEEGEVFAWGDFPLFISGIVRHINRDRAQKLEKTRGYTISNKLYLPISLDLLKLKKKYQEASGKDIDKLSSMDSFEKGAEDTFVFINNWQRRLQILEPIIQETERSLFKEMWKSLDGKINFSAPDPKTGQPLCDYIADETTPLFILK